MQSHPVLLEATRSPISIAGLEEEFDNLLQAAMRLHQALQQVSNRCGVEGPKHTASRIYKITEYEAAVVSW